MIDQVLERLQQMEAAKAALREHFCECKDVGEAWCQQDREAASRKTEQSARRTEETARVTVEAAAYARTMPLLAWSLDTKLISKTKANSGKDTWWPVLGRSVSMLAGTLETRRRHREKSRSSWLGPC